MQEKMIIEFRTCESSCVGKGHCAPRACFTLRRVNRRLYWKIWSNWSNNG